MRSGTRSEPLSERGLRFSLSACWSLLAYRRHNTLIKNGQRLQYGGAGGNADFWKDAENGRFWDGRPVELVGCNLTEWIPLRPGLYYFAEAEDYRRQAAEFATFMPELGLHYPPGAKGAMLEGGVGCVRPGAIKQSDALERKYLIGASFSSACHGGIPLMVRQEAYESLAEELRDMGQLVGNVSGRVCLLEDPIRVGSGMRMSGGGYYISVESLELEQGAGRGDMQASAFITFALPEAQGPNAYAVTYCSFSPRRRGGEESLLAAVEWMRDYVDQYGDPRRRVVADFDVYGRWNSCLVDFPIQELLAGRVLPSVLQRYASALESPIVVLGDYIQGDSFSGINNSTIVNRSVFSIEPESPR